MRTSLVVFQTNGGAPIMLLVLIQPQSYIQIFYQTTPQYLVQLAFGIVMKTRIQSIVTILSMICI